MSISIKEFWVIFDVASEKIDFLIDTEPAYPDLTSYAGPFFSKSCTVTGVKGKPHTRHFTCPLTCQFEQRLISHAFLAIPEQPTPLLGRDLLRSLRAILWLGGSKQAPHLDSD